MIIIKSNVYKMIFALHIFFNYLSWILYEYWPDRTRILYILQSCIVGSILYFASAILPKCLIFIVFFVLLLSGSFSVRDSVLLENKSSFPYVASDMTEDNSVAEQKLAPFRPTPLLLFAIWTWRGDERRVRRCAFKLSSLIVHNRLH